MKSIRAAIALFFIGSLAHAQIPAGWYVVGTTKNDPSSLNPGLGGLYRVDPAIPGPPVVVSGLSCELTGDCGSPVRGVTDVLIDPFDVLLVGEIAPQGEIVDLHLITLSGSAVSSDVHVPIGSPAGGSGSVRPMGRYENGDLLIGTFNCLLQNDGTTRALWAILRPATGAKRPIEHPILLGVLGSIPSPALDAVYFTQTDGSGCELYRLPVPVGGQPELEATLPELVEAQFFDLDGFIVATEVEAVPTKLYRIDPESGSFTVITTDVSLITCADLEPHTGQLAVGAIDGPPSHVYRMAPDGCAMLLSAGPPGGWGNVQGFAVNVPPVQIYCTSEVSSNGCVPVLSTTGSLPTDDFAIHATSVEGARPGLFFYSVNTSRASIPFNGGFLCSSPPYLRSQPHDSGGAVNTCTGVLSIPWSTGPGTSVAPGDVVRGQFWYRDPASSGGSNTTEAIEFGDS